MTGAFDRANERAVGQVQREDIAEVTAFDSSTASYTLLYRGATIGPVWSLNSVLYAVGDQVTVLVQGNLILHVIP